MNEIIGHVHSIETCGTVDGPGIRFVIFMQGCPLRCKYCHNPDTWDISKGKDYTTNDIFNEILKYKSYMKFSKGGVTVSGGEPLLQIDFLIELFKKCKQEGIHTAIDTSGFIFNDKAKKLLELTDLVILDIKNFDNKQYKKITNVELQPTLNFLHYLYEIQKPTWIRYVLVPNLSDNLNSINNLSEYLTKFSNIEKIEVLPFHKMGEYKWSELGLEYELKETVEPDSKLLNEVINLFKLKNPDLITS